jgi:hypothetical protein
MADTPRQGEGFGRYRIVGRIGHGGMGTVFEAVQENLGRSVALKVLLPQLSDEQAFRTRFDREAHTLAALDSPHVIQVYDYGEEAGQLYIATQRINGPDLQRWLAERGALPAETALEIVAQVASGLADAHAAGLLHRDIKPSNVLVREGHGELHAYLCDMGIARTQDDDHTLTTGIAGTVGYMAPERHQGVPASVQSDIYSLGCLLWALVSGDLPYAGSSGVQMALAHMNQPVPQLGQADPVSVAIDDILRHAMDKQPGRRYAGAVEMRRDLLAAAETARRAGAAGAWQGTTLRPLAPATELRAAIPVPLAPTGNGPRRRRGSALLLVAAAALVAIIGISGLALAGGHDSPATAADPPETPARATATPEHTPKQRKSPAAPRSTRVETPRPSHTPSAATTVPAAPTTPEPVVTSAPATILCWSGQRGENRAACGIPAGVAGLQTVFPSMQGCQWTTPTVAGKAEVYVCNYGGFLIRYTRWDQGYDRYGYLIRSNRVRGVRWNVDSEVAGSQWTSYETRPSEDQRYQWSATYREYPYSVSVDGVSAAARQRGLALVDVAAPSHIGLR